MLPQGDVNLGDLSVARQSDLPVEKGSYVLIYGAGDILEVGAYVSIRSKDIPSFDRYFSQLQTFYTDYRYVSSEI